ALPILHYLFLRFNIIFSICFPTIQNNPIQIVTIIVFTGLSANSRKLDPTYAIEKIMTDFPNKTARINCCLLTLDNAATTLMTEDGENGKQSKINNGPNPC